MKPSWHHRCLFNITERRMTEQRPGSQATNSKSLPCPPMHMQLHEPILATGEAISLQKDAQSVYSGMSAVGVPIHLVVSYDDVAEGAYEWLVKLPVSAIGLDFCGVPGASHGCATAQLIAKYGFPKVSEGRDCSVGSCIKLYFLE